MPNDFTHSAFYWFKKTPPTHKKLCVGGIIFLLFNQFQFASSYALAPFFFLSAIPSVIAAPPLITINANQMGR